MGFPGVKSLIELRLLDGATQLAGWFKGCG